MIKISKRLESLAKYIDKSDHIIDIGCDHALLDIYIIKKSIVDKLIISDISLNALEQGILNIKKYKLEESIDARCGNGLEVLNNKDFIDTIIISGMGTNTILGILDNEYLKNINKLIIQSNRDYYELRKYICSNGFYIENEEVIVDNNKLYINIMFVRGNKNYSTEELKYGTEKMINKNIYYNYLTKKYENIINNCANKEIKKDLLKEINYLKKYAK